ncbi:Prepilin-type N-terminal cleavage/methylation domain-containing protein [Tepidanaerobacter acetatoxydans Re1]|uniref:Prepilin-type N-terminal cleavage/methylation domain-containing protein n=1 Tax=Tepidanaerobacter acetatoxydans (strain DSM 21804 / JCM 16047 / Re1) TaxID=1209989 RepID=L0S6X7_TEPAE|nr:prepilin-type N-terminal cleavage/methylation domain-containing protein [Tepidanaerobacter acetatoxydans]CCP27592.1 Prepilin-type N-terminal cleavage/methylation domain-containing protein [Tepidanaerobacter acetatoxydans Re1]
MSIKWSLHNQVKDKRGFTLIELIIVIAVLGILATLTIPKVINIKSNAETAANEANEKIIRNALERYYADNMEYPNPDSGNKLPKEALKDYLNLEEKLIDEWEYTKTGEVYNLEKKQH